MRRNLFGANVEVEDGDRISLQNPRMIKVVLDGEVLARHGAMVAYQGAIEFAFEGFRRHEENPQEERSPARACR